jgi:peptidoglycan/xylan/chitin deacetylase (PgdA/CDA1 family)
LGRPLPQYYTDYAPFRELFATGTPILTYHKIGNRPAGARLKGLYVSEKLFHTQLEELKHHGFRTAGLGDLGKSEPKTIVITFDDGFRNVLQNGRVSLRSASYKAIQFLLPDRIGKTNDWDAAVGEIPEPLMTSSEIREWLAEGHEIGSHTCTHPFLTRIPVDNAKEEIGASKKKLEDNFGIPIKHFCYPYGDCNDAIRDLVQEAGYETACTTEFGIYQSGDSLHSLKRITARYKSRNLKNTLRAVKERFFSS